MMLRLRYFFIYLLISCLHLSCKKETDTIETDVFSEETEQLSELSININFISQHSIEIQWNKSVSNHFTKVTYDIYIDNDRVIDNLELTKYSLINLISNEEYTIKVVAKTDSGLQKESIIKARTLSNQSAETDSILYKEYKIHSYSDITGNIGIKQFSDGGHLIARMLRHPEQLFSNSYKLIVFRTDQKGNLLWYRLFSAMEHGISPYSFLNLTLYNQEKEGIIFAGSYGIKISTDNGETILKKNFNTATNQEISNLFHQNNQKLIIGTTNGSIISVNPKDLEINWVNSENTKTPLDINTDSRGNIYVVFDSENHTTPTIRKYSPEGLFLFEFTFVHSLISATLLIDENDDLFIFSAANGYNILNFFKFDKSGTLIKKGAIQGSFSSAKAFINNKGEIIVYGRYDGNSLTAYGGIFIFDKDIILKSKRFYTEIPFHSFSAITQNSDSSFNLFLHFHVTYSYRNLNFIFIKTKEDGSIQQI